MRKNKRWIRVCIFWRRMWREMFDDEYNRRRTYQKRASEMEEDLMTEPFDTRMKMLDSIYKKVVQRTRDELENNLKDIEVEMQMKHDDIEKYKQQLSKL